MLRAIAAQPNITTSDLIGFVYLSREQVLRRLRSLREQGLIITRNSAPGQTFRYELNPNITLQEIEQANARRLNANRDPVAREALGILLQGLQKISAELTEMIRRIENILK